MNASTLGIGNLRDAERTIRLLLHRARKPGELARFPLAFALCAIFDCSDPAVALRRIVEDALAENRDVMLRDLILRCDIEGNLTLREACDRFAVSRRHFQRYRARAVNAIAERTRALVLEPDCEEPLVDLIA